ncbi:hypothetical protein [Vibrio parahaemolyticus]|uniref:hypothetical protein n=1 Tax=Vibrio parahaemolyticus TaxID=670 RepID=UPI00287AE149|nr:hypothetical protein [Vibrio parahaemolyticus]MDS1907813.1 hypothetical protein [Vibrio parahaemolyticus]
MKKSQFIKKVLKERPSFRNIDTFFFIEPFEHILCGFFCEITPRGAYVWKFVYPLFDRFDCLSLLYSERLVYPEGYIDFANVDRTNLASEFVSRTNKFIESAHQYLKLEQFCELYSRRPDLLKHERAEMTLGYSYILLGKKELANKHLISALEYLREPALSECQNILSLLDIDIEEAKLGVLQLEQVMKKNIGLEVSNLKS